MYINIKIYPKISRGEREYSLFHKKYIYLIYAFKPFLSLQINKLAIKLAEIEANLYKIFLNLHKQLTKLNFLFFDYDDNYSLLHNSIG